MSNATQDIAIKKAANSQTSVFYSIWALFTATLVRQAISRRSIVLAMLFLLPIGFAFLIRYNDLGFHGPHAGYEPLFGEFLVVFLLIPVALVPFTALVFSSGLIQDEIEEQTITYLLIRPLPRWSIFVAKLLATMVVTITLTAVFTMITYVAIGWGQADYWSSGGRERMVKMIALLSLSMAAYDTLFAFFSLLIKRALLVGIAYIIALEGVMAFVDFVIRKLTIMYYFRVLSYRWMNLQDIVNLPGPPIFTFNIDMEKAPDLRTCLFTLAGAILTILVLASLIMQSREFRVKTPEGN